MLANIALSALDEHFDQQWHQEMGTSRQRDNRKANGLANWRLIRYCDDFVLMVTGDRRHAEALREEVSAVLAPLGLRLAPEKTKVVHIDEGFTFLGFDIRRLRKRGSFTWLRLMRWIRRKYQGKHRPGMKELRNRFCDKGWRFAWKGVVFTGASSVAVTRYCYRGHNIATPWTPRPAAAITSS